MTLGAWDDVAARAAVCVACPELAATRKHVVFGQPPAAARELLLVGEAPGADEDATGLPFVGKSGQLLNELLTMAGLQRERLGVVNVLKCRPPGNRKPAKVELASCRTWLEQQVALTDPLVLVALGGTATQALLGSSATLTSLRGRDHLVGGRTVIATYHPSAAIRFGPRGAPRAALAEDLAYAARRLSELRQEPPR